MMNDCEKCTHESKGMLDDPCSTCWYDSNFKPKEKEERKEK